MPGGEGGTIEIKFAEIANPEAIGAMLDFLYQVDNSTLEKYNPSTQEINKDVLRLAERYKLPGLTDLATRWLAKNLHTGNVVERLAMCEDFHLEELRERILDQFLYNKAALAEAASSPQIVQYPSLMQALLKRAAQEPSEVQPKKKARRKS